MPAPAGPFRPSGPHLPASPAGEGRQSASASQASLTTSFRPLPALPASPGPASLTTSFRPMPASPGLCRPIQPHYLLPAPASLCRPLTSPAPDYPAGFLVAMVTLPASGGLAGSCRPLPAKEVPWIELLNTWNLSQRVPCV